MFDAAKMAAAVKMVKAMPEVTKEQAMEAFLGICNTHDEDCPHFRQILAEIVGHAISAEDPEMTRRFVVWERDNGPLTM